MALFGNEKVDMSMLDPNVRAKKAAKAVAAKKDAKIAASYGPTSAPAGGPVSPMTAPVAPIVAPPVDVPVKPGAQFELMKTQAKARLAGQEGQARDAMNRKLASLGNLNSGAALKLEQNLQDSVARQQEEALGGIDVASAQDVAQREESAMQRRLQSSQFDRSLGEQQRQAAFTEGLALREADLSEYNTMYNTALSAATSDAQTATNKAFERMFGFKPTFNYGGAMQRRAGV